MEEYVAHLFFKKKYWAPYPGGAHPLLYVMAWRRESGIHAPSLLARDPFVGCQDLAPQLPDKYSMDASCTYFKGLIIYHLYLILIGINQIKKVEDSYEIRIYLFKIIEFLLCVRIVPI